jgi:ferric-dicitrate binding protein FerR (iron transport regulator)
MTERDLNSEWARTQLEAWADGTLTSESRARMEALIAADPRLERAAERAAAVHRALRASRPEPMPRGLRRRLLAIPGQSPRRHWFVLPAFASAAAAAAVVAAVLWLSPEPPPPALVDPRVVAAKQDLETAMRYLQRSAVVTQGHVTNAVGTGVRATFAASRNALARETDETGG